MAISQHTGCVVLGAGLAAAHVVQSLRQDGYHDPIALIGDEPDRPYERPPLSKDYLQGKTEADTLFVHEPDWYGDNDIDTRFGEVAASVDREGHQVQLASGEVIGYRHLVIATGSSPRTLDIPGVDLPGVHLLRKFGDSNRLRAALQPGRTVVVIGAGWIGLEVAAAAKLAGLDVTVLEYAQHPLQQALGEQMAEYFARLHRDNGVDLRTGVTVTQILGRQGQVTGVQTSAETFAADLVVMGVGAAPNTDLAAAAGLQVDNGIVVDASLRTGDPAVLACGDVANAFNTTLGRRLRVEHWDNAIRQGRLAAQSILERPEHYDWQPYFFTDQFDLGMEYVGHGSPSDQVVVRGEQSSGEFIAFWLGGDVLNAAMNVNIWDVNDDLRALIGRSIDTARLADPSIPLTDL